MAVQGVRFIGEKVVHHPTVFAMHCEGCGWTVDADAEVKNKFWGASMELHALGVIRLTTADGEEYRWNKVSETLSSSTGLMWEIDGFCIATDSLGRCPSGITHRF